MKTHWKKNNDSTYISGEDLHFELNGLKKDFPVVLQSFKDGSTFDRNEQKKVTKTVLNFTDLNGVKICKGVLLNNTAGEFLSSEFKSPHLEDWVGKTVNIFAKADSRHGFVVRFKKYFEPPISLDNAKEVLNSAADLKTLVEAWGTLSKKEQTNQVIINLKNQLKETLK
tara:strand:- start:2408 stop:2914 length:507 start_codon:yes stop_codon:yes gene_type:complete